MSIDLNSGIIRSKLPDIPIPNEFAHDFILSSLEKFPPDDLCETELASGKSSTYACVIEKTQRIARWFHKNGIGRGDRIAFYCDHVLEYTPCILGAWTVGACCGYIRPEMIADKDYRISVGVPRVVFATENRVNELLKAGFENIIIYNPSKRFKECLSFDEVLKEPAGKLEKFKIEGAPNEVLALVTFTGGTTGNPKPIQLTHRCLMQVIVCDADGVNITFGVKVDRPVHLTVFPTVHVGGLINRIFCLPLRTHTILTDKSRDSRTFCEAVQKYRINVTQAIPVGLIALSRFPDLDKYDLSSWKHCCVLAGSLVPYIQKEMMESLQLDSMPMRLGQSECASVVMAPSTVPGSIGYVCPNNRAIVRNIENGSPITQPGEVGELTIKGPSLTIGYYNLPEKTAEAIDKDGFFKTGDLVYFDSEFNFYYFDRIQEFIRHPSGNKISSTDLELIIIYQNPSVAEVSVISSPNGPRAVVVPISWPENEKEYIEEIIRKTNDKITEEWRQLTGGVALKTAEEIPRTVLGKHIKRMMRSF